MTEMLKLTQTAELQAKITDLLAEGWTEVTGDLDYGPTVPGVRKFVRPRPAMVYIAGVEEWRPVGNIENVTIELVGRS